MPDQLQEALLSKLRGLWDEPTARMKMALPRVEAMNLEGPDGPLPTIIPHPPQFQPQPQVVGQDVGRAVHEALKVAPALQGRVGTVQVGTTPDVMSELERSNKQVLKQGDGMIFNPAEDFPNTSLLGLTNMHTGNISLSPRLGMDKNTYSNYQSPKMNEVLGHELTHAAGYPDEVTPNRGGELFEQLLKRVK